MPDAHSTALRGHFQTVLFRRTTVAMATVHSKVASHYPCNRQRIMPESILMAPAVLSHVRVKPRPMISSVVSRSPTPPWPSRPRNRNQQSFNIHCRLNVRRTLVSSSYFNSSEEKTFGVTSFGRKRFGRIKSPSSKVHEPAAICLFFLPSSTKILLYCSYAI